MPVPPELLEFVREKLSRLGTRKAAVQLRIGEATVLGVLATGTAMRGTVALLRETFRESQDVKQGEA